MGPRAEDFWDLESWENQARRCLISIEIPMCDCYQGNFLQAENVFGPSGEVKIYGKID